MFIYKKAHLYLKSDAKSAGGKTSGKWKHIINRNNYSWTFGNVEATLNTPNPFLSGMSEELTKEALLRIYLNPYIWMYVNYEVQRELHMFLIEYFESYSSWLPELCGLPRILDVIRQFYWDKADTRSAFGTKPLLHPVTKQVMGERPSREEICKIRLLLLSLAEMAIRYICHLFEFILIIITNIYSFLWWYASRVAWLFFSGFWVQWELIVG